MEGSTLKRRRVMSIIAGGGVASIAGCIGGDEPQDNDTTEPSDEENEAGGQNEAELDFVHWAGSPEAEILQERVDEFQEENSDINVERSQVPYDQYNERLTTQVGSGNEPDLFQMDLPWWQTYARGEALQNLRQPLEDHPDFNFDNYFEPVLEMYQTMDGEQYTLPKDFSTVGVFYRNSLLEQAGIETFPETWSEFREALERLDSETDVRYPFVQPDSGQSTATIWQVWIIQNGGQVLNDDRTEAVVGSDENIEALEFYMDLREDGLIGLESEIAAADEIGALGEGETAIHTSGVWLIPFFEDSYPDLADDLGAAAPPRPESGEPGNQLFGSGWAISAGTEHLEPAIDLLNKFAGEGMADFAQEGIALSPYEAHLEGEIALYEEDERYATFIDMLEGRLRPREYGPQTEGIQNTIVSEIQGVVQGGKTPREALETAESIINDEYLNG